LSSIFGKVLDLFILSHYSENLESCDLQFGFMPKRSTAMCSAILKEVISFFVDNNSSVNCVFWMPPRHLIVSNMVSCFSCCWTEISLRKLFAAFKNVCQPAGSGSMRHRERLVFILCALQMYCILEWCIFIVVILFLMA